MDATLLSTDAGQVEVSDRGDGPPVLVLHGSPGGIDVAELMGRFLRIRGFRVIAISRPGYLGTPLRPGNRAPSVWKASRCRTPPASSPASRRGVRR